MAAASSAAEKARPLPHYALPNFSVVLPTYSNHESDVISQAFRVGNFVTLHDLPHEMRPGQVSRGRFQKILDNRQPVEEGAEKVVFRKPKTFSEFEYMPSPYSIVDDLKRDERLRSEAAMAAAGHPSVWRSAGNTATLPHEDSFGGESPFYRDPDPYERADDEALRWKWLQDAQILAEPFKPSGAPPPTPATAPPRHRRAIHPLISPASPSLAGRVKGQMNEASTEMPNRQQLPHIVDALRKAVHDDWEEYNFLVCATDDEHVVIRFEMATLESEPGLVSYMNVFSRTSSIVSEWRLKKVVEDWNVTPGDGHLYFTFRPPWISAPVLDTYYSLHPEERVYQDKRVKSSLRAQAGGDGAAATDPDAFGYGGTASDDASATGAGLSMRPELT